LIATFFIASPTVEYEQTRRTAESTVRELWYFLRAKSEKILTRLDELPPESQEATQRAATEVKNLVMNSAGYTQ